MKDKLIGSTNEINKILIVILGCGMVGISLATIAIGLYIESYSHHVALVNSEIAYMRIPVLIIAEVIIALFLLACIFSFGLLINFWKNRIFSKSSVILLRLMGLCFALIIIPSIILIIYTMQNVVGSITNLWVEFGILLCFVASSIFVLIANIVNQGLQYKQENELTV